MSLREREELVWHVNVAAISELLSQHAATHERMQILEGGCGSGSYLRFPPNAHVVGIDISPAQLQRNARVHEGVVGDLQTYAFTPSRFDAIVCWDVLEHLSDPGAALDRFALALRDGGLLILGFPNRASLKGVLTRTLPFRIHVWIYKRVFGVRDAGMGDRGPFPTPMRAEMDRQAVVTRMAHAGFEVITDVVYESPMVIQLRHRFGLVGARWTLARRMLSAITAGRIEIDTTDCMLVLAKSRRE